MSDSTVGPRAEDAPSPKEEEPLSDVAPGTTWGEKLSVPGVPSKPLSDVVNRAFANPDVEKTGALRWLKDTLQKGELRIPGTAEPRPIFCGVDPALAGTEYASIQVRAVPGAPVNEVYLLDLEALPKFDIGKYHFDVVFVDALDNLGKPDPEGPPSPGLVDFGPPSPETFARDLERLVTNADFVKPYSPGFTQHTLPRAVCSMSAIRAALDGFGEPASGPPCFLCDATPCICGRAL